MGTHMKNSGSKTGVTWQIATFGLRAAITKKREIKESVSMLIPNIKREGVSNSIRHGREK